MLPETIESLLDDVFALRLRKGGPGRLIGPAKRAARARGLSPNPLGDGNSKLGLLGNYRPVGPTCPASCPYLGAGCYAQSGLVHMAQRRASAGLEESLSSAAIVMGLAARYRQVARLHVSGDVYGPSGSVDLAYVEGLCALGDGIRRRLGRDAVLAYGYTHAPRSEFEIWRLALAGRGVRLRYSSDAGERGAVVEDFSRLGALREAHGGARFAKCPAQLDEITQCADCRICWERPELTVVFEPHGPERARLERHLGAPA